MLSYRSILKQAWKISWKNKYLWFFGFFASFISFTAEFKVISHSISLETGLKTINNIKMFLNTGIFSRGSWQNIADLFRSDPKSIILLIFIFLIVLAITLFFVWLATVSQIGIINSVNKIMKGSREKLSIKTGLKVGNKKFWPVFGLNLIISIIINTIYLLISLMFILVVLKNQAFSTFLYGLIFIIFIPISLFLSFVFKYAIAYSVIENKKFCNAIKQGWRLFFKNWLISVEVAIILFFVNLIAIILLSTISFIGFFLLFGIALSSIIMTSSAFLFWLIIILGVLLILAIIILGGSLLNVFQISSWTDLFVQLRDKNGVSKLERTFQK